VKAGPTVRRPSPRVLAPVLAIGLVLTTAGCGSAASSAAAPSSSPPSSSPVSTASPSASSSGAFAILPQSVLADLSPLVYASAVGADAGMAAQGAKPAVNAVFLGGISRELTYEGKTVAGVDLYRFNADVPADTRAKMVPLMVQSFAQVAPTAGKLGKATVQVADGARGSAVTVIGWTHGDDVVLVWSQGLAATQQIAQQYLTVTGAA
jgi:hypothetical protein